VNGQTALTPAAGTGPPEGLDRDAPLPLYFQLREAIQRDIRQRALKPGDRLPTEGEIERRYGVSRATIRQALADLASAGAIRRVQGLGTFVAAPKIRHIPLLTSFSELVTSQGFVPSHHTLSSTVGPVPADVAAELQVEGGAPARHLERLLLADDDVVGLADTWLSHSVIGPDDQPFEPENLKQGSLYAVLQGPPLSLALDHAEETISAAVAGRNHAELLGCPVGSPILAVRRLTFTPEDRPVESTRLLFVGDRYEYRVELHRPGGLGTTASAAAWRIVRPR